MTGCTIMWRVTGPGIWETWFSWFPTPDDAFAALGDMEPGELPGEFEQRVHDGCFLTATLELREN